MAIIFNADEIFEIAIQIEKNGFLFYTKAADNTMKSEEKEMLRTLAGMEQLHEKIFEAFKKNLKAIERESETFDPFDETILYLKAFASGHVFDLREDPAAFFNSVRTMKDVLGKAMSFEKDSIAFYLGIKNLVPEKYGKDKIQTIISEEMGHVRIISERMALL